MATNENERARRASGQVFDEVSALLFRDDPIGINYGTNADEYDPETRTILPRLGACRSEADVLNVVIDEFHRWFGEDIREDSANYKQIAASIWEIWSRRAR